MEYKIFKQRSRRPLNEAYVLNISSQLNISPLSAQFLARRGFSSIGQIEEYLYPKSQYMFDPYMFSHMEKAVKRIERAIETKEKICIYGDYDCDGVCATLIMYKALCALGADVIYYLPDRFKDGYGLTQSGIQNLAEDGARLLITVDNGISAYDEIELANKIGLDVILTDHHTCAEKIPAAYSILNPKLAGERYPFDDLCGAGVAYKLAYALLGDCPLTDELLLYAAVATIADLVPLLDENRVIVSLALKNLRHTRNLGLKSLIGKAGLQLGSVSFGNIAFQIAPRINAAGRLYRAETALELLLAENEASAAEIAELVNKMNAERKSIEESIMKDAQDYIAKHRLLDENNILFIPLYDANEGVIGVVAGKLAEKYHRPAVIGSASGGIIKCSARSIPGFDIYTALLQASALYIKFGGHKQAAGLSISEEHFADMADIVRRFAKENGIEGMLFKRSFYDIDAVSSMLSTKAIREIDLFAPFGIGNPKPVYRLNGVNIRNLSVIGSDRQHCRFNVVHNFSNFSAVAFFMAEELKSLDLTNRKYDILFTPGINAFNGKETLQLELKDISVHIEIPSEYYESLYAYFYAGFDSLYPAAPQYVHSAFETVLEDYARDTLFVLYGKDALARVLAYADYKNYDINAEFGFSREFKMNAVNILVNPAAKIPADKNIRRILFLDPPCFGDYPADFTDDGIETLFLKSSKYFVEIVINRDYIAFVYKKLRMLDMLRGDIYSFIEALNNDSETQVNYFTLRICLDVMADLEILEYAVDKNQIFISFKRVSVQKDINQSEVMKKLTGIFDYAEA